MAKKIIKKTTVTKTTVIDGTNKTLIVCILDRSGSMGSIVNDAIGGFNEFLKKQKKLDEDATMTVALFDDRYELLYNNVNLQKVKKITRDEWSPRGMTALNDAIGKTINDVESEIRKLKRSKRPDKILVAIVTDGYENASKEYTGSDIKKLIKKKEKDDWQFVYLAANQDAFNVGTSFGVSGGNTFSYSNTAYGNTQMFDSLGYATKKFRSVKTSDVNYAAVSASLFADSGDVNGKTTTDIFTTTADKTDAKDEESNS
jgi:uncharacterized protein YegL